MPKDFDPYNVSFAGQKLDPYRVIELFQITHPAIQQVIKKALRMGAKHKTQEEDAKDIITSAQRFLDMLREDELMKNHPRLPFDFRGDETSSTYMVAEHPAPPLCPGCAMHLGLCNCGAQGV